MSGKDAIRHSLQSTQQLLGWYLSDLQDADLVVRPVAGANHIAWQLGHLIHAEQHLIRGELPDAAYPPLPAGFGEKHTKETASKDASSDFATKAEYLDAFNRTREATIAALANLASDADLDRPTTGNLAKFAPTLGEMFLLVANHSLMHGGQFSVIRRKLGKPVLF